MIQLITPTPIIPCQPGWCLQYVRQAFGLPARYGSATEAWEKSTTQHPDRNFPPGLWVPVWYGLDKEPAGHVVLLAPNGTVYSTSDLGNTPHLHPDLADLESYYAYYGMTLTYRGWTEDVAGYPVVVADTITAQSGTVTPLENPMPLTPEETAAIVDGVVEALLWKKVPKYNAAGQEIGTTTLGETVAWNEANFKSAREAPAAVLDLRKPAPDGSGHSYTLAEYITYGWAYGMNAGPRTLGQEIRLADGTVTSLASLLAAIYQKPAGAPASVDVEALVARLKAELPPATVAALATQLTK